MIEFVNEKNINEYEEFLQKHPKGHFMQSSLWAKQKPDWKWRGVISRSENGQIRGAMSVLIRRLPGLKKTLMYAGRGPVADLDDFETIRELTDAMRNLSKEHKAYVFKIDPDVTVENQAFCDLMKRLGYRLAYTGKNFSGIQPRFVFRLNVENKTEEELLAFFHHKTRYNIRVAERKGVEVKIMGPEAVEDFSRIMLETGLRDGFQVRNTNYFRAMLENLGEHARLYMAYLDGTPIAGSLAIYFGDKVWYLYGASSNQYRDVMPNYLLQWNMIKWAVEKKVKIYDFRGVSGDLSESNPLYGLYKFKKGFNGDFCEFLGEFDLIFDKCTYFMVKYGERAFRRIRKMLFMLKKR